MYRLNMKRLFSLILAMVLLSSAAFAAQYRELQAGSKDSAEDFSVYSLQSQLKDLGYTSATPDGVYGAGTARAVKAFQKEHGLEETGVADVQTQELLFSLSAERGEGTTAPDLPFSVSEANSGNKTYIVQGYLRTYGYTTDLPDGKMGAATKSVLKQFQKDNLEDMKAFTELRRVANATATAAPTPAAVSTPQPGMPMMDVVEDELYSEIQADGKITDEWFDYIANGYSPIGESVEKGSRGDTVKRMQRRMYCLGYIPGEADGVFGEHTAAAVKYFQKLNGMKEDGVCSVEMQKLLYSGSAVKSDQFVTLYKAMVSIKDQRVYIYAWDGEGYNYLVHTFLCSTGTEANPTITGTFQAPGVNGEWYYMEDSEVWVRYAFVIQGGTFFHSVLFRHKGDKNPTATSLKKLGERASHGCVRLSVEDSKWIYENCANGMTVVIYED